MVLPLHPAFPMPDYRLCQHSESFVTVQYGANNRSLLH